VSPGSARGEDTAEAFAPLLRVLHRLAGIDARVGGGWGVDLLAGRVTRVHHDIDCFVAVEALGDALRRLADAGFEVVVDECRCRVVLTSSAGKRVDLGGIGLATRCVHMVRSVVYTMVHGSRYTRTARKTERLSGPGPGG